MKLHDIETIFTLARELPALTPADCRLLLRRAHALHRLFEVACNVGLGAPQERRQWNLETNIARAIRDADLKGIVDRVKFCGDPRGAPVRIHFKPGICGLSNCLDGSFAF